ncbi:MAG TPA: sigma 54-interacting transcriptional regulator [Kofleriaceae bacterium]|nr:sigma 54-interacting transcriptional regulator [Kofleriaceae bacterium]
MQSDHEAKPWVFTAGSSGRRRVLELAKKIAGSNCPVLILGPTGVGKEVLAEDIHAHSSRITGRFVAINCASLTPSLFESELFGHHRGAYTGASTHKVGLVELADQGTLFLDEVSELPLEIQAKLLRFLARGTFWPLGSTEERAAHVRVIAAANRDLRKMIPAEFREDLFYRLSVVPLILPQLESEDTRLICLELTHEIACRMEYVIATKELGTLSNLAAAATWPGGVRELRNVLERYFLLRDLGSTVEQTWEISRALSAVELHDPRSSPALQDLPLKNTAEMLRQFDDLVFLSLARDAQGVRELADRLGRTPQAVYDRLKRLGLSPDALQGDEVAALLFKVRGALVPYRQWIQALFNG